MPDCELTWLIEPAAKDLVVANPAIDKVLILPRKAWLAQMKNPLQALSAPPSVLSFFRELRGHKFDLAIDAQGLLKSALPAYLSGAPRRVGFAGTREGASRLLTDPLLVGDYFAPDRHVVDLNLALADHAIKIAGGMRGASGAAEGSDKGVSSLPSMVRFPLPDPGKACRTRVSGLLSEPIGGLGEDSGGAPGSSDLPAGSTKGKDFSSSLSLVASGEAGALPNSGSKPKAIRRVALIPSTTWTTKIWSEASWTELGVKLAESFGVSLVLVGGPADRVMNQSIYKGIAEANCGAKIADLTGETGLMDLVALFEMCDLVVGADTGPLHLAAAVAQNNGSPNVVAVHGSTPWLRNGPYGYMGSTIHLNLDCQPCFEKKCPLGTLACLKDLPAGEVLQTLSQFFDCGS